MSATLTSHVSRRASSAQGSGMLRAYIQIFPHIAQPLKQIKKRILQNTSINNNRNTLGVCGHAATCFGAVCGLLGVDLKTSSSMFLYSTTRDMINAAVRMNLVGPLQAGGIVNRICSHLDQFLDQAIVDHRLDGETVLHPLSSHQISPLVEILANAHDRLYTRLFNS